MRKIDRSQSKEYLPLILHIEDIEEILNILSQIEDNTVNIYTDDYEFDTLSELCEYFGNQRPKSLYIKFSKPYGTIYFNSLSARIYINSSSLDSSGIFYKIDQILSASERQPRIAYSYYSFCGIVALQSASIFLDWINYSISELVSKYDIYILIMASTWLIWAAAIRVIGHSIIILKPMKQKTNFFKKNFDQIGIVIIGAVVGALLTIFMTKILDKQNTSINNNVISKELKNKPKPSDN